MTTKTVVNVQEREKFETEYCKQPRGMLIHNGQIDQYTSILIKEEKERR